MHDLGDREAIVGVVPDRTLRVDALEADEIGLRMYYSVSPPYPAVQLGESSPENLWALLEWRYEVSDDLGTTYVGGGGARHLWRGVKTVTPPLPSSAKELVITLRPFASDTPRYDFEVAVPGPSPWRLQFAPADPELDRLEEATSIVREALHERRERST